MEKPKPRGDVTELLAEWACGNPDALDRLVPLVYRELRAIAAQQLRRERGDHTLQPTALVHEAYLKLVNQRPGGWRNRGHFFAVAAQAMRRTTTRGSARMLAQSIRREPVAIRR